MRWVQQVVHVHPPRGWEALQKLGWSLQAPRPKNPQAAGAEEQAAFRDSIDTLKSEAQAQFGKPFEDLTAEERQQMLQEAMVAASAQAAVVAQAKEEMRIQARDQQQSADTAATAQAQTEADLPALHWFTPIQQLTLFGFFTSEVGATQVLRYEPVPGEYVGDLEYDGGPAWAT